MFFSQLCNNNFVEFKTILKDLRMEKGLSQKELAIETGLSLSAIGKWEAGFREPSGNVLIVLSKYFKVSTDYLLGLEK